LQYWTLGYEDIIFIAIFTRNSGMQCFYWTLNSVQITMVKIEVITAKELGLRKKLEIKNVKIIDLK